jgi:hypothetical protein
VCFPLRRRKYFWIDFPRQLRLRRMERIDHGTKIDRSDNPNVYITSDCFRRPRNRAKYKGGDYMIGERRKRLGDDVR